MTFQINATVNRVHVAHGFSTVTLTARADEIKTSPYGTQVAGIISNTEGRILTAEITLQFEGEESPFIGGEVVTFGGHFSVPARAD